MVDYGEVLKFFFNESLTIHNLLIEKQMLHLSVCLQCHRGSRCDAIYSARKVNKGCPKSKVPCCLFSTKDKTTVT